MSNYGRQLERKRYENYGDATNEAVIGRDADEAGFGNEATITILAAMGAIFWTVA